MWTPQRRLPALPYHYGVERPKSGYELAAAYVSVAQAAGVTPLTVTKPTGLVVGDFLLCILMNRHSSLSGAAGATLTTSVPWNQIGMNDTESRARIRALWRTVAANEPADYTFTFDMSIGVGAIITAFRGVLTTGILIQATTGTSTGVVTLNGVTTTIENSMLVGLWGRGNNGSWSGHTEGITEVGDVTGGSGSTGTHLSSAYQIQAATGATGTRSATSTFTTSLGAGGYIVALQPDPNYGVATGRSRAFFIG